MSLRDTVEVATARNAVFAPDGKRFAYVVEWSEVDANERINELRVGDVGGTSARTLVRGESIAGPVWSDDGSRLYYLAKRDGAYQLFSVEAKGGEPKLLFFEANGIGAGMEDNYVEFAPPFTKAPGRALAVFVTRDLATARKEADKLLAGSVRYTDGWTPSHFSRPELLLVPTRPSAAPTLWMIDLDTGLRRQVWRTKIPTIDSIPIKYQWSPDGSQLAVIGASYSGRGQRWEVNLISASDGSVANVAADFGDCNQLTWSDAGRALSMWTEGSLADPSTPRYNYRWMRYDLKTREWSRADEPVNRDTQLKAKIAADTGDWVHDFVFNQDYAVGVAEGSMRAPIVTSYTLVGEKVQRAPFEDRINAKLDGKKLGETQTLEFELPGKEAIYGGVVLPVDYQSGRRYPLVVMYYNQYKPDLFMATPLFSSYAPQVFAANGFVVFMPRTSRGEFDYAPGDFEKALQRHPEGIARQLKAMIKNLDDRGIIDRSRMGVMGWSWGAFYAPYILTHYPDWFKAGAMGEGAEITVRPLIGWGVTYSARRRTRSLAADLMGNSRPAGSRWRRLRMWTSSARPCCSSTQPLRICPASRWTARSSRQAGRAN